MCRNCSKQYRSQARAKDANRRKKLIPGKHGSRDAHAIERDSRRRGSTADHAAQCRAARNDAFVAHSVVLLRSLVDDVLDISKIEAGRLTIEITDFDLYATLNSIIKMMRPHAEGKGLALRAMVDPAIDYHVKGDPHHLRQVLVNLLSNAVKFTERGHIDVSAMLLNETSEGFQSLRGW